MKKKTLLLALCCIATVQAVYAGVTTERDIGACTARNRLGYCMESRTHTCFDINPATGKCRGWTVKNGDQFKDIMRQFESYNQDLVKGVKNTPATKTKANAATTKVKPQTSIATKAEAAAKAKAKAAENSVVPNSLKISQSIKNIDTRIQVLTSKQNAGVDVSAELELLSYKSQKLWELPDVKEEHRVAYSNLTNGVITQEEYDTIAAKLRRKDIELATSYDLIMNITSESLAKAIAEEKAIKEAADKKAKKKEIARRLLNQGTLYTPPAASNWIRQGADALELFK